MSTAIAHDLDQLEKRSKVVELAKQGKTYRVIAAEVGYASPQSVANQIKAWAEETRPSREDSDAFRAMQLERLEAMHAKLWAQLEVGGEVNLPVVDRLLKVAERASKLMGADLQQNVNLVAAVTMEQIVQVLGYDESLVVEGTATEVTDGCR